jgi:hypothetical protein
MNERTNDREEMNTDVELHVNFSSLSTSDQNCNTSSNIPEPLQYVISKQQHFASYLRTEQQRNGDSSGRISATCFALMRHKRNLPCACALHGMRSGASALELTQRCTSENTGHAEYISKPVNAAHEKESTRSAATMTHS